MKEGLHKEVEENLVLLKHGSDHVFIFSSEVAAPYWSVIL
jgi:hypothetical protein